MRPFWKLARKATKQRLKLLQSDHFVSKIKNAKKHAKSVSTRHCSCSMQKTGWKKWDHSENWQKPPLNKGSSLCKIDTLGEKLKLKKTS